MNKPNVAAIRKYISPVYTEFPTPGTISNSGLKAIIRYLCDYIESLPIGDGPPKKLTAEEIVSDILTKEVGDGTIKLRVLKALQDAGYLKDGE